MLLGIALLIIGFAWLLFETRGLTIRLPFGAEPKVILPARYVAYAGLKKRKTYDIVLHRGANTEESTGPLYTVVLDPGITEPLCGWDWLDKHVGDLVDYQPRVQMELGGVRYDMTIRAPSVLTEVMKVNKLSKAERAKYA